MHSFIDNFFHRFTQNLLLAYLPIFFPSALPSSFSSLQSPTIIFPCPVRDPVGVSRWYANFKRHVLETLHSHFGMTDKNRKEQEERPAGANRKFTLSFKKIGKKKLKEFCEEEIVDSRPASSKTYADYLNKIVIENKTQNNEINNYRKNDMIPKKRQSARLDGRRIYTFCIFKHKRYYKNDGYICWKRCHFFASKRI